MTDIGYFPSFNFEIGCTFEICPVEIAMDGESIIAGSKENAAGSIRNYPKLLKMNIPDSETVIASLQTIQKLHPKKECEKLRKIHISVS